MNKKLNELRKKFGKRKIDEKDVTNSSLNNQSDNNSQNFSNIKNNTNLNSSSQNQNFFNQLTNKYDLNKSQHNSNMLQQNNTILPTNYNKNNNPNLILPSNKIQNNSTNNQIFANQNNNNLNSNTNLASVPQGTNQNQDLNNTNITNYKIKNSEINRLIDKPIAREIRSEKWRGFFLILFGLTGFIVSCFFIGIYYYATLNKMTEILGFNVKRMPLPFIMIATGMISFTIFIFGCINMRQIIGEVKNYLKSINNNAKIIPHFITSNFKKTLTRKIVINWIALSSYVIGGILLGFFYAFNSIAGRDFSIGVWSLGKIKNLDTEIIVMIVILITTLLIHITVLLLCRIHRANIISYYGYEIVSAEEMQAVGKKVNKRCIIVFLVFIAVITVFILLIWLWRRKKNKK